MKHVIDFLENKKVEETYIFNQLDCSLDEVKILHFMTSQYINGTNELNVNEILIELFGTKKYEYLKHLYKIKHLLDSGWIISSGFGIIKNDDALLLETLNSSVSLSSMFLKILEDGSNEAIFVESTPYKDHLEYLQEQFYRIELHQKASSNKNNKIGIANSKIKEKLHLIEGKIDEKIKATTIKLPTESIFDENELNEKEKIIFLALLKEEYSGDFDSIRELNALLALISLDDYEKIKNRTLLEDSSKLISNNLIDYDEIMTGFGGVSRSFFINEDILQTIMNPDRAKKSNKIAIDTALEEQDIFELVVPKTTLDDVVMHPKTRELMDTLLKQVDRSVIARLKEWGIKKNRRGIDAKVLLYGPPGTGKTMTAVSLGKSLKKRVLSFDCSKILSKYVGESEQNVRKIFDTYKDICQKTKSEPILLLNEADQFLSARTESTSGGADKMHNQMQNIFLEQIERFEGILVATTNFLESLDMAFSRRFDYKIAFERPDFNQRLDLWRRVLPEEAIYEESFDIKELATYPLSGGQIVVVLKNTALKVAVKEEPIFTMEDFKQSIQREQSGAFGEKKLMGFVS